MSTVLQQCNVKWNTAPFCINEQVRGPIGPDIFKSKKSKK